MTKTLFQKMKNVWMFKKIIGNFFENQQKLLVPRVNFLGILDYFLNFMFGILI